MTMDCSLLLPGASLSYRASPCPLHIDSIMSTASGWILERMVHAMLATGGQFNVQSLPWAQETQNRIHKTFEIWPKVRFSFAILLNCRPYFAFSLAPDRWHQKSLGDTYNHGPNFSAIDSLAVARENPTPGEYWLILFRYEAYPSE